MKTKHLLIFAILFFATTASVFAQTGNRCSKGGEDTIVDGGSNYFFQGSWLEYVINANGFGPGYYTSTGSALEGGNVHFNGIMAKKCFTDSPLKVIGLAVVGTFVNDNFSDYPAEYLYLYESTPDTFQLLRSVAWNSTDPHKYYQTRNRGGNTDCSREQQDITYSTFELREYYFDTAVTVSDSFYVGFSSFRNLYVDSNGITEFYPHSPSYVFGGLELNDWCRHAVILDTSCYFPMTTYKLMPRCLQFFLNRCFDSLVVDEWNWVDIPCFAYVFPIIEIPDTFSCPSVDALQVTEADSGCVMLLWEADSTQTEWTVCYGPEGTDVDSCETVTVSEPALRLCGLDTCTKYVAYVRAVCHHNDSIYYTEWSDSATIAFSCDTTSYEEGISTIAKQKLLVVPNPASDHVTVTSPYTIESIDVFDMQGHCVYTTTVNSNSVKIYIASFVPASYIVVAHTTDGIVSRKIVVHHTK